MATLTITLSDGLADWIDRRVRDGSYRDPSDLVGDLVERERSLNGRGELTIEDLRQIVREAEASGISNRTIEDIIAEGDRIARDRGFLRD